MLTPTLATALALVAVACRAPGLAQAPDPEELFRRMERALAGAKTFRIEWTAVVAGNKPPGKPESGLPTFSGTFKFAEGNRVRLDVRGAAGTREYDLRIVSDGSRFKLFRVLEKPAPPWTPPAQKEFEPHKKLSAHALTAFARGGGWSVQEYLDGEYRRWAEWEWTQELKNRPPGEPRPEPLDLAKELVARNFARVKAPAQPGGRRVEAIEYDLVRPGERGNLRRQVWLIIDAETLLPIQRTVFLGSAMLVELYSDGELDAPLDPATFDLSR